MAEQGCLLNLLEAETKHLQFLPDVAISNHNLPCQLHLHGITCNHVVATGSYKIGYTAYRLFVW